MIVIGDIIKKPVKQKARDADLYLILNIDKADFATCLGFTSCDKAMNGLVYKSMETINKEFKKVGHSTIIQDMGVLARKLEVGLK